MKVYDTLSQEIKEFVPIDGNNVKIYVCGPTVYDFPHLGHARCYITWDMVVRYLEFKGYNVTYARNVTDVDDKIINKAKAENTTTDEIAARYYKEFSSAMEKLNVRKPDIEPRATKTIGEMIKLVKDLEQKGFAYNIDGDVYFDVSKFEKYGELGKQNIEDLKAGARIETTDKKDDPLDFSLWKPIKPDEDIFWDSPWGKGRPGWHLECSAMIKKHLGETIDIHAGGQDLIFPHHENEKAQSECANGVQFVKYWMHNGFVIINSEKMSKSLKNFVTINDVLADYDANTIRFFILTNHYRMPVDFNEESLNSAKAGVQRLKNAYNDVKNAVGEELIGKQSAQALNLINSVKAGESDYSAIKNFIDAMDEDFNTSKALAVLFELAGNAQKTKEIDKDESALNIALLLNLSGVLGFDFTKTEAVSDELASKLMDIIIEIRKDARNAKDWALSDKIRDELNKLKITLKDAKDGQTSWSIND